LLKTRDNSKASLFSNFLYWLAGDNGYSFLGISMSVHHKLIHWQFFTGEDTIDRLFFMPIPNFRAKGSL